MRRGNRAALAGDTSLKPLSSLPTNGALHPVATYLLTLDLRAPFPSASLALAALHRTCAAAACLAAAPWVPLHDWNARVSQLYAWTPSLTAAAAAAAAGAAPSYAAEAAAPGYTAAAAAATAGAAPSNEAEAAAPGYTAAGAGAAASYTAATAASSRFGAAAASSSFSAAASAAAPGYSAATRASSDLSNDFGDKFDSDSSVAAKLALAELRLKVSLVSMACVHGHHAGVGLADWLDSLLLPGAWAAAPLPARIHILLHLPAVLRMLPRTSQARVVSDLATGRLLRASDTSVGTTALRASDTAALRTRATASDPSVITTALRASDTTALRMLDTTSDATSGATALGAVGGLTCGEEQMLVAEEHMLLLAAACSGLAGLFEAADWSVLGSARAGAAARSPLQPHLLQALVAMLNAVDLPGRAITRATAGQVDAGGTTYSGTSYSGTTVGTTVEATDAATGTSSGTASGTVGTTVGTTSGTISGTTVGSGGDVRFALFMHAAARAGADAHTAGMRTDQLCALCAACGLAHVGASSAAADQALTASPSALPERVTQRVASDCAWGGLARCFGALSMAQGTQLLSTGTVAVSTGAAAVCTGAAALPAAQVASSLSGSRAAAKNLGMAGAIAWQRRAHMVCMLCTASALPHSPTATVFLVFFLFFSFFFKRRVGSWWLMQ